MRKTMFVSFALLVICAALTFFILLCFFQECWHSIMQETTYAIFTGCIFAIPSTGMVLIIDRGKSKSREYKIAWNLAQILQKLSEQVTKDELSEKIAKQYIEKMITIHTQFNEIAINYLFLSKHHEKCLNAIQIGTFDVIELLREFTNQTSSPKEELQLTDDEDNQKNKLRKIQDCLTAVQELRQIL